LGIGFTASTRQQAGEKTLQLRLFIYILWVNALAFLVFFMEVARRHTTLLSLDVCAATIIPSFSETQLGLSGWLASDSLLFLVAALKLLLPPMQLLLLLFYRVLSPVSLAGYFSLYYCFMLTSVLFFFLSLLSAGLLGWLSFFLVGLALLVLALLQLLEERFVFGSLLGLSTTVSLSFFFIARASVNL